MVGVTRRAAAGTIFGLSRGVVGQTTRDATSRTGQVAHELRRAEVNLGRVGALVNSDEKVPRRDFFTRHGADAIGATREAYKATVAATEAFMKGVT